MKPSIARVYLADNLASLCMSTIFHLLLVPSHFSFFVANISRHQTQLLSSTYFPLSSLWVWKSKQQKPPETSLLKLGLYTFSCKGEPKENQGASQSDVEEWKEVRKGVWGSE